MAQPQGKGKASASTPAQAPALALDPTPTLASRRDGASVTEIRDCVLMNAVMLYPEIVHTYLQAIDPRLSLAQVDYDKGKPLNIGQPATGAFNISILQVPAPTDRKDQTLKLQAMLTRTYPAPLLALATGEAQETLSLAMMSLLITLAAEMYRTNSDLAGQSEKTVGRAFVTAYVE